jgi:hypothetical protein
MAATPDGGLDDDGDLGRRRRRTRTATTVVLGWGGRSGWGRGCVFCPIFFRPQEGRVVVGGGVGADAYRGGAVNVRGEGTARGEGAEVDRQR